MVLSKYKKGPFWLTLCRLAVYGYADADMQIRIRGVGYADTGTRIRIRRYGYLWVELSWELFRGRCFGSSTSPL